MDGLTIGFVARELNQQLKGGRIDRISQPEKDLLLLVIRAENQNRKLLLSASPNNARCHLTNENFTNPLEPLSFCMLLRKQLLGGRILSVLQESGDRIVHINMDTVNEMGDHVDRCLILEIMGRHSNLILTDENGRIMEAVKHVSGDMNRFRQILPGLPYLPPPSQSKIDHSRLSAVELEKRLQDFAGVRFSRALMETINGLSPTSAEELAFRALEPGETWPENLKNTSERIERLLQRLPEMAAPRVIYTPDGEAGDIFAFPYLSRSRDNEKTFVTISQALESFFGTRDQQDRIRQKSAAVIRTLKNHVERCEKKLSMQEEELASADKMDEFRIMGELINANLYQIKKGMTEITLPNWFGESGTEITVPLDIRLTPSQNAQRYFKKYQKARNASHTAAVQKKKTLEELDYLEQMLLDTDKCEKESELEEIRQELIRTGYLKRSGNRKMQRRLPQSAPYRYISADGIEILVGKNALQNERLTLAARPDEMWLHAKDMPGSHVIICMEGEIPITTMKQAALLAAWYSKGQKSSLVPIDYTRKRYVKKPAGAAAGKVIYTHQKTAYLTPEEEEIRAIRMIRE
ncbi:MAG: NFACT family protein [Anaerolineaceae bacterium]|nr:NFACT family protein [Anaerolineaceae bacterium]